MKTIERSRPGHRSWEDRLGNAVIRRYVVSILGLSLILFVDIHATLNLVLLGSPASYGEMVRALHSAPYLVILELILLAAFLAHAIFGLSLNKIAITDPKEVILADRTVRRKGLWARLLKASGTLMAPSGAYLLCFMAVHVYMLKQHGASELYDALMLQMQHELVVVGYILAALFLGLHLVHGVQNIVLTFVPWPGLARKARQALIFLTVYPVSVFMILPLVLHIQQLGGGS